MNDGRSSTEVVRRDSVSYHVTVGWYGNGTMARHYEVLAFHPVPPPDTRDEDERGESRSTASRTR